MKYEEAKKLKEGDKVKFVRESEDMKDESTEVFTIGKTYEVNKIDVDDSNMTVRCVDDEGDSSYFFNDEIEKEDYKVKPMFSKEEYEVVKKLGVGKIDSIMKVLRKVHDLKDQNKENNKRIKELQGF